MTLQSRAFRTLRDKLKSLYLPYHSPYGPQIWEDGELPWGAPTHKAK